MKKYLKLILSLVLALALVFSLAGCDNDDDDDSNKKPKENTIQYPTFTPNNNNVNSENNYAEYQTQSVQTQSAQTNASTVNSAPANSSTDDSVIDAFEGISFTVTGISPYCKISINTAGCSEEAQGHVAYNLDKEYYANGETAVITAVLTNYKGEKQYTLKNNQATYTVSNQPEYIKSLDGVDLTFLKQELDSYITANTAAAIGEWGLFGKHAKGNSYSTYKSVDKVEKNSVYFTSVKKIKENAKLDFYNSLNFIYSFSATMQGGSLGSPEKCAVYVNITAYNIVKYPDGTLKWGKIDPDSYEFKHEASTESANHMVTTCISVQSADYNITQVE